MAAIYYGQRRTITVRGQYYAMLKMRIKEALATIKGAIFLFLIFGFPFILFGVISLGGIIYKGALEDFKIGNVEIPKFMGAGASYLDVFIFCIIGILAVAISIYARYRHHKATIDLLRSKGIHDYDGDGKIDNFTDKFLDDL